MHERLEIALCEAATLTFEDLAFIFPTPLLDEPVDAPPLTASASVTFRGPCEGRLEIWASQDVLPALAANMLGVEDVPPVSQQNDALGEIANVICGNLLPSVAGPAAVFYLAAPEVGGGIRSAELPTARIRLALDPGQVELRFFLEGPVPVEGVKH